MLDNDKNSVGVNVVMDNNTKQIAFGFYIVIAFITFVKLVTSFNKKD